MALNHITMTEFWPWWIDFGAGIVALLALLWLSYAPATDQRKYKFRLAALMVGAITVTSGQFALGQTWWNRDDGQHVQWGPWAVIVLTLPAAAGVMCASLTHTKSLIRAAFVIELVSAASVYWAAITPLRNGGNARDSAILMVCWAYAAILVLGVYLLAVVMGWTRRWSATAAVAKGSGEEMFVDARDVSVQSRVTRVLAVLGFCAVMAVYPSLWAAGPVGFRGYTDQFTQTCLLAFLANGLLVLYMAGVYWLINPDGSPAIHRGRVFEAPESQKSLLAGAEEQVRRAGAAAVPTANAQARIGGGIMSPGRGPRANF